LIDLRVSPEKMTCYTYSTCTLCTHKITKTCLCAKKPILPSQIQWFYYTIKTQSAVDWMPFNTLLPLHVGTPLSVAPQPTSGWGQGASWQRGREPSHETSLGKRVHMTNRRLQGLSIPTSRRFSLNTLQMFHYNAVVFFKNTITSTCTVLVISRSF